MNDKVAVGMFVTLLAIINLLAMVVEWFAVERYSVVGIASMIVAILIGVIVTLAIWINDV